MSRSPRRGSWFRVSLLFVALFFVYSLVQLGLVEDRAGLEATAVALSELSDVSHETDCLEIAVAAGCSQHAATAPPPPTIRRADGASQAVLDSCFQAGRDAPRAPPRV